MEETPSFHPQPRSKIQLNLRRPNTTKKEQKRLANANQMKDGSDIIEPIRKIDEIHDYSSFSRKIDSSQLVKGKKGRNTNAMRDDSKVRKPRRRIDEIHA
ncbi:hypothetical protein U1Q18_018646 [Sarracenia purpurea var. burkii]